MEETFTTKYCYKRRVFDNRLVLIGEIFNSTEDSNKWYFAPWNSKIVGQKESTKSLYYSDFYDKEGNKLNIDSHAYQVQLYIESPITNETCTTGMIDRESCDINSESYITYWDNYVDNRVIEICYQTNELHKELKQLRGVD